MIRAKSVVKGTSSFVINAFRNPHGTISGTVSALGSYAIFMRYVRAIAQAGSSLEGRTVLEVGPGSSLGVGIAALLSGATRYYAYDLVDQTDSQRNLAVFDEMVELFRQRAPVPIEGWCARIFPFIDDRAFPHALLPDQLLHRMLAADRISALRHDLATGEGSYFRARFAQDPADVQIDEPIDLIISESVLEHVDDLESTYQAFARWLSDDGIMVHLIDYSSHNLSRHWNGHWQCSPLVWSLTRGKRLFLINRVPHQGHVDLLQSHGFKVVHCDKLRRVDGLTPDQFSPEFRSMGFADATTCLAALICRRQGNEPRAVNGS
jgi:SAM-dependent methyltransferase